MGLRNPLWETHCLLLCCFHNTTVRAFSSPYRADVLKKWNYVGLFPLYCFIENILPLLPKSQRYRLLRIYLDQHNIKKFYCCWNWRKLIEMTWEGPELNPYNPVYLKCRYVWSVPIGLLLARALRGLFKIMVNLVTGDSKNRMLDLT